LAFRWIGLKAQVPKWVGEVRPHAVKGLHFLRRIQLRSRFRQCEVHRLYVAGRRASVESLVPPNVAWSWYSGRCAWSAENIVPNTETSRPVTLEAGFGIGTPMRTAICFQDHLW